jgi:hypothetical protein
LLADAFRCLVGAARVGDTSGFGQQSECELTTECFSGVIMLWTIFVILLVLWLLGVVSSYTLGGFIHILLVLAIIALIFQLISGRRTAI